MNFNLLQCFDIVNNLVTFCARESVRTGRWIGDTVWASIWSAAISKAWDPYKQCHNKSHSHLPHNMYPLDLHEQIVTCIGTRSISLPQCTKILIVPNPCIICKCNPSTHNPIHANPELDLSHANNLLLHSLFSHSCMLDPSV